MSKVFVVDIKYCNGCRNCQIACKDEHCGQPWLPIAEAQPMTGQFWCKINEEVRGQVPLVKMTYTPVMCGHCENRVKGALEKISGIKEAHADHARGEVQIICRRNVEEKAIEEAITQAGYVYKGTIPDKEENKMKETVKIEGMMCGHCEATVKKALEALDGVEQAEVSHEKGEAVLTLSHAVADKDIQAAVEGKDYKFLGIEK